MKMQIVVFDGFDELDTIAPFETGTIALHLVAAIERADSIAIRRLL